MVISNTIWIVIYWYCNQSLFWLYSFIHLSVIFLQLSDIASLAVELLIDLIY